MMDIEVLQVFGKAKRALLRVKSIWNTIWSSLAVLQTLSNHTKSVPNGYVYTIYYLGNAAEDVPDPGIHGDVDLDGVSDDGLVFDWIKCNPRSYNIDKNITAETLVQGKRHPTNCTRDACADGVVQRGALTVYELVGEDQGKVDPNTLDFNLTWNSPAQGPDSIQAAIEQVAGGKHKVNVTREVIGKYGIVQWLVRFVYNRGVFPHGAGDVPKLTRAHRTSRTRMCTFQY